MLDFIKTNRTMITMGGSMIAGIIVAICNVFKVQLDASQKAAIDTIGTALCVGLICLENYIQNKEHKKNENKLKDGEQK
jgi:hypothetical protein